MIDLSACTVDEFEPYLDQSFQLELEGGGPLALVLSRVVKRGAYDPQRDKRQAFSLVFRGPAVPILPQRIYGLRNSELGTLEIFLVPLGPDDGQGMLYEAVFT